MKTLITAILIMTSSMAYSAEPQKEVISKGPTNGWGHSQEKVTLYIIDGIKYIVVNNEMKGGVTIIKHEPKEAHDRN
jgi:hypothetical protein